MRHDGTRRSMSTPRYGRRCRSSRCSSSGDTRGDEVCNSAMLHSDFKHALVVASALVAAACSARPTQITNSRTGAFEAALTPFEAGFAAAWYDTRDGNGEIYVRLLDKDGEPDSPELRLTNSPEDSFEASIDRLGDVLAIAWYDQTATGQQTAKLGLWTRDGANRWVHTFARDTRNPVVRTTSTAIFC